MSDILSKNKTIEPTTALPVSPKKEIQQQISVRNIFVNDEVPPLEHSPHVYDEENHEEEINLEVLSISDRLSETQSLMSLEEAPKHKFYIKPNFCVLAILSAIKFTGYFISVTPLIDLRMEKIVSSFDDPAIGTSEYLRVQTIITIVSSITGIVTSSYFGALSDRRGRVFVFLLCAGLALLVGLINLYVFSDSYTYECYSFLSLTAFSGIDGSVVVLHALSNSYITDIVSDKKRLLFFSAYQCVIVALSTVVPLVSALVVKTQNNYATLKISLSCYIINLIGVWCFLSESVSLKSRKFSIAENDRKWNEKKMFREELHEKMREKTHLNNVTKNFFWTVYYFLRAHVVVDVLSPLKLLLIKPSKQFPNLRTSRINILIVVAVHVFYLGSYDGAGIALTPYAMIDLKWTSLDLSYFYSFSSVISTLVLLTVPQYLFRYLTNKKNSQYKIIPHGLDNLDVLNTRILSLGMIFSLAIPLLFISSQSLYACTFFSGLVCFATPTAQNCVLKHTSTGKTTGEVLSAFSLLSYLTVLILPPVLLQLYDKTKYYWPTLFLIVPITFSLIGLLLTGFLKVEQQDDQQEDPIMFEEQQLLLPLLPIQDQEERNHI